MESSPPPVSSPMVLPTSSPLPPRSSGVDMHGSSSVPDIPSSSSHRGHNRSSGGMRSRGDLAATGPRVNINMPSVPGSDVDSQIIWGTTVRVQDVTHRAKSFIGQYESNGEILYTQLLQESLLNTTFNINLDAHHILEFDEELYIDLIRYPQEVVPIFDTAFNEIAQQSFQEDFQNAREINNGMEVDITVRPFNLKETQALRLLEPKHIDQLVATSGMVIRVSAILPDMQSAWFKCTKCQHEVDVSVENGRIDEPTHCQNQTCRAKDSYQLIYYRSYFADRQLLKVQESPESIPEGETPHTIDVFCHDNMVDFCKPGDRIEVTGVYRCRSVRSDPKRKKVESVFQTYLDAVHIQKVKKSVFTVRAEKSEQYSDFTQGDNTVKQIEVRKAKLREMGQSPDIYERLAKSFAPSIWEMEDVKKGILCQLFGATTKNFGDKSVNVDSKFRNELNVLLMGDPGTAKSQLLQYVHKIAPRGIYTSGKGSSAVGLTAYITKDPDTHDLVLESGALVLSDRGICCIDEFDKMGDGARSILHEVMEQQTVSIAKAGIICQLNARTSILAAANPIESRYNPRRPVTENIDLPPTLLSRFDLIYLILDRPNMALDRILAQHLVSLYYAEENRVGRPADFIDQKTFQEYVAFSREEFHPTITEEAGQELVKAYTTMRNVGRGRGRKTISATPRNLESLIRLGEALARMRHSNIVEVRDVQEAVRLQGVATHAAATDPRTGEIDMGILNAGTSDVERQRLEKTCDLILDILKDNDNRMMRTSALKRKLIAKMGSQDPNAEEEFISDKDIANAISQLERQEELRCDNKSADDPMVVHMR